MKKVVKKSTKYKRPSWDEYFLKLVEMVGTRGTCDRGRSGCVIVRDKRIYLLDTLVLLSVLLIVMILVTKCTLLQMKRE